MINKFQYALLWVLAIFFVSFGVWAAKEPRGMSYHSITRIPDVQGKTLVEAKYLLTQAGFKVDETWVEGKGAPYLVTQQDPPPSLIKSPGTLVHLKVNRIQPPTINKQSLPVDLGKPAVVFYRNNGRNLQNAGGRDPDKNQTESPSGTGLPPGSIVIVLVSTVLLTGVILYVRNRQAVGGASPPLPSAKSRPHGKSPKGDTFLEVCIGLTLILAFGVIYFIEFYGGLFTIAFRSGELARVQNLSKEILDKFDADANTNDVVDDTGNFTIHYAISDDLSGNKLASMLSSKYGPFYKLAVKPPFNTINDTFESYFRSCDSTCNCDDGSRCVDAYTAHSVFVGNVKFNDWARAVNRITPFPPPNNSFAILSAKYFQLAGDEIMRQVKPAVLRDFLLRGCGESGSDCPPNIPNPDPAASHLYVEVTVTFSWFDPRTNARLRYDAARIFAQPEWSQANKATQPLGQSQ